MKSSVAALALLAALLACVRSTVASTDSKNEHRPFAFWELLMINSAGVYVPDEPACLLRAGDTCVPGSTDLNLCCAEGFCYDTPGYPYTNKCCPLLEDGALCNSALGGSDCCVGSCVGAGPECATDCFSRDTKVQTRESPEPVAIRDLRVGQHAVLCYEGGVDMLAPGAPAWCELKNFIRADDTTLYPDMVRLSVSAVDGSATTTTTTVSSAHIMHLVTDAAAKQEAGTPAELGAFVNDIALNTRAGQLTPMPTSSDLNTTFKLGVIERVEVIEEVGKYVPGIEHPWIWADGIVQPIWGAFFRHGPGNSVAFPVSMQQANALKHMLHAPLWMAAVQPSGTPGRHAHWGNSDGRAPLLKTLTAAINGHGFMAVSGAANFTRALEWFAPRYHAWKADPSKPITEADVFEVFPSLFTTGTDTTSCSSTTTEVGQGGSADVSDVCPMPTSHSEHEQVYCYSRTGLLHPTAGVTSG